VASVKNTGKQTNILEELQTNLVQQLAMLYETVQTIGPNKNPTKYASLAAAEFHLLNKAVQTIAQLYEFTLTEIEAYKEACNALDKCIRELQHKKHNSKCTRKTKKHNQNEAKVSEKAKGELPQGKKMCTK
jgi:septation ring formation regulator EzrA